MVDFVGGTWRRRGESSKHATHCNCNSLFDDSLASSFCSEPSSSVHRHSPVLSLLAVGDREICFNDARHGFATTRQIQSPSVGCNQADSTSCTTQQWTTAQDTTTTARTRAQGSPPPPRRKAPNQSAKSAPTEHVCTVASASLVAICEHLPSRISFTMTGRLHTNIQCRQEPGRL